MSRHPLMPDTSALPPGPTVTIPAADYRRLLDASEGDDMIVRCEVCGAWLDADDPATATTEDFTGCWKAATRSGSEALCRSYRATVLEGLPAEPPSR